MVSGLSLGDGTALSPRWSAFAPDEGRLRRGLTRPGERRTFFVAFLGDNT